MGQDEALKYVKVEMTPERKQRMKELTGKISDLLHDKAEGPMEAIVVLQMLADGYNKEYFNGQFQGIGLLAKNLGDAVWMMATPSKVVSFDFKVPPCRVCGAENDKMSIKGEDENVRPKVGDVTLCATCGEIMCFTVDGARFVDEPELSELLKNPKVDRGHHMLRAGYERQVAREGNDGREKESVD